MPRLVLARRLGTAALVATALVVPASLPAASADAAAGPVADREVRVVPAAGDPEVVDRTARLGLDRLARSAADAAADDAADDDAADGPEQTGRLLVRRAAGVPDSRIEQRTGFEVQDVPDALARLGWAVVDPGEVAPEEAAASLEAQGLAREAVPELVRRTTAVPSDPYVAASPYLDELRLPQAWDRADGAGTVVAVLDSGVRAHDELAGRLLPGYDFVDDDGDPDDTDGHGTLVAGVAAAGVNGRGGVGAAHGARVLPVRVLGSGGGTDLDVAQGILWAADQGADVLNLSLGGPGESPLIEAALRHAVGQGAVVVVASGNDGSNVPNYPAAYAATVPGVLSVGATDDDGRVTGFSSWGDHLSVTAPGVDVIGPSNRGPTSYVYGSGTSFAAPLVSGVAALVVQHNPTWTPEQVAERLRLTTRDAGPRGLDPYYGTGVVDAAAAVGLGPGVPDDRAAGDGGTDDLPGGAVPMEGEGDLDGDGFPGTVTRHLAPEGDVDWMSFDGPHRVAVRSPWQWPYLKTSPTLEVRDAATGALRGRAASDEFDVELEVGARAGERLLIRLGSERAGVLSGTPFFVSVGPLPLLGEVPGLVTPGGSSGFGATTDVGDLTGDGLVDLLAVNAQYPPVVSVFPGVAEDQFGAPIWTTMPSWTLGGRLVDVVGDPLPEVVVAHADGLTYYRVVAGSLVAVGGDATVRDVVGLAAGDLDGDQDLDLVVSGTTDDGPGTVVLERGPEGVTGRVIAPLAVTYLHVGDFDGDPRADVGGQEAWLVQQSDGSFVAKDPGPWAGAAPTTGDVDGDGRDDVVLVGWDGQQDALGVSLRRPDGSHGPIRRLSDDRMHGVTNPVASDVDGDGDVDVVVMDGYLPAVFLQQDDGTFERRSQGYQGHVDWHGSRPLTVVDLDDDGDADVVRATGGFVAIHPVRAEVLDIDAGPWVSGAQAAVAVQHAAGSPRRPDLQLLLGRDVQPGSVATAVTVLDAAGRSVAVSTTLAGRTLTVRPTADLASGAHYQLRVRGLTDVDGGVMDEPVRRWVTVAADGDRFTPVPPVRLYDTRDDGGPLEPGDVLELPLAGTVLPDDATAVVLNVTAAEPAGPGFVQVFPKPVDEDAPFPVVSNVNVVRGVDQPNLVTARIGADGAIWVTTGASASDVVIDLAGYYAPGAATGYVPLAPQRVLDLRDPAGPTRGALLQAGQVLDVPVRGRAGVPADALAVVLNLTGTDVTARTNVRAYPTPTDGSGPPLVSNLNLLPGRDQPNLVTVQIGGTGSVRLANATGGVHLVADVAGYYSATGDHGFVPVDPVRISDSRSGLGLPGALRAGTPSTLQVTGRGGVPAGAGAVVVNLTGVEPARRTDVRAYPATTGAVPTVSALNLVPGRAEANLAVVTLNPAGAIGLYSSGADVHLVADVAGYFRQ